MKLKFCLLNPQKLNGSFDNCTKPNTNLLQLLVTVTVSAILMKIKSTKSEWRTSEVIQPDLSLDKATTGMLACQSSLFTLNGCTAVSLQYQHVILYGIMGTMKELKYVNDMHSNLFFSHSNDFSYK